MKATKTITLRDTLTAEFTYEYIVHPAQWNPSALDGSGAMEPETTTIKREWIYTTNGKRCKVVYTNGTPETIDSPKLSAEYRNALRKAGRTHWLTISHSGQSGVQGLSTEEAQIIVDAMAELEEAIKPVPVQEEITAVANKEITEAQEVIETAAKQDKIMTNTEYKAWRKWYNDVMNEGGDGYVPRRYTIEDVEAAKLVIAKLAG